MTTFLRPSRGKGDHTMGSHRKAGWLKKHLTDAGIATALNYPKTLPFYAAYGYLGLLQPIAHFVVGDLP
jgi:hypothetical protein